MKWILYLLMPLFLSLGLGVAPKLAKSIWIILIAIIVCVEVVYIGYPNTNWKFQQILYTWILGIALPWIISGIFLGLSNYPRNPIIFGISFLAVYSVSLLICLVGGDMFGFIPQ